MPPFSGFILKGFLVNSGMTIVDRIFRKFRFILSYLRSLSFGYLRQHRYKSIESFIIFVGYPRSGHSLIAALLDAHPEIVISMEWGALSHLRMESFVQIHQHQVPSTILALAHVKFSIFFQ